MKNLILFLTLTTALAAHAQSAPTERSQPQSETNQKVSFTDQCAQGPEITVSAVGDVLLHTALQLQAFNSPQAFRSLWPAMEPVFKQFDLSYANFEGPAAEGLTASGSVIATQFKYNSQVYTSYPSFNYHPRLVKDLLASGLDIVSTANNHALDRRKKGADMTIDAMNEYGLKYTGTRPTNDPHRPWYTITESRGLRIAWLACTFSTNGIPDSSDQVLNCYKSREETLSLVNQLSQDPNISAVIVTPHWGNEYQLAPAAQEIKFGQQLIDAGALAVLGTHPHVIQPWKKYLSPISKKEGLIVFSSGNFVSGQFHRIPTQVGLMTALKLVLDGSTQKLKIKQARYLPLMMKRGPYRVEPVINDTTVAAQFSSIWQNMYPDANRIKNLEQIFPVECR